MTINVRIQSCRALLLFAAVTLAACSSSSNAHDAAQTPGGSGGSTVSSGGSTSLGGSTASVDAPVTSPGDSATSTGGLIVSSGSTSPGGSIAGVDAAVTNTGGSGASNAGVTVSTGGVTAPGGTTGSDGSAGSTGGSEADGGTAGNSGAGGSAAAVGSEFDGGTAGNSGVGGGGAGGSDGGAEGGAAGTAGSIGAGGSGVGGSGGGSVTPFCAENNSKSACRCSSAPFALTSDDTLVANCDNPGSGSGIWACTYDLNSVGESTTCSCTSWGCAPMGSEGVCEFSCGIGATCVYTQWGWWYGGERADAGVAYCFETSILRCTWTQAVCPSGLTTVDSCTTIPPGMYTAPPNTKSNCAGLKWAPPPPAPDGGALAKDSGAGGCTLTHCSAPTFGSQLFQFSDSCCGDGAIAFSNGGETLTCGDVVVTCSINAGGCHDNMGASCTF